MRIRLGAAAMGLLLMAQSIPCASAGSRISRQEWLQALLQKKSLDPVRHADQVETFALEDVLQKPANAFPSATYVATDLPGSFVALPERSPVGTELGRQIAELLLSPGSYAPWFSACMFSPGVAIRFHRGAKAIDVFVCFHCREVAFQQVGSRRALFKLSFDPVQERLFELVREARPDDLRLEEVRKAWDDEAERARHYAEAEKRWRAAMPSSLGPHWSSMGSMPLPDVGPMRTTLAREMPEPGPRILALLEWYGTGAGPWSGFPAYEEIAENLLLTHSTSELLAAIEGRDLTPGQIEGVARLFAGWTFREQRPGDLSRLPADLRIRLLRHSLESEDEDKRKRAQSAFGAQ